MVDVIRENIGPLTALCHQYGVHRLELFGSAANEKEFDDSRSDLDFLVEFQPDYDLGPCLKNYFSLRDELEGLYGRSVDLVMTKAVKNSHFLREAARTRTTIYAA